MARQAVMAGVVMILRKQSAPDHPNWRSLVAAPSSQVVVQNREIEDRIECSILAGKFCDVIFYDGYSTSVLDKYTTGSLDHLRIEVDRSNSTRTKSSISPVTRIHQVHSQIENLEPSSPSARPPGAISLGNTLLRSRWFAIRC